MRQVRAGPSPDPVAVAGSPSHQRLVSGELAFRRGDWLDAIAFLEPGVESSWSPNTGFTRFPRRVNATSFYLATESLATAWLEAGDKTKALHVLENAAQARPEYRLGIRGAHVWFRGRARLAREYRKLGRLDEAVTIEDDVLHMLKHADADHPVVL